MMGGFRHAIIILRILRDATGSFLYLPGSLAVVALAPHARRVCQRRNQQHGDNKKGKGNFLHTYLHINNKIQFTTVLSKISCLF